MMFIIALNRRTEGPFLIYCKKMGLTKMMRKLTGEGRLFYNSFKSRYFGLKNFSKGFEKNEFRRC